MVSGSGPRLTLPTQLVLRAMLTEPTQEMYGLQIGQVAELPSRTIHPILARLEACGWLESRWEDINPAKERRSRRRSYRLSPDGANLARNALAAELERILQAETEREGAPGDGSSVPGRVPRGLVALAVRVLPMRERPRYAQEFHVELGELPRRERLGYALRVLAGAGELRRALTEPVPHSGRCTGASRSGVGSGVAGVLAWLTSGPGVIGGTAVAVTVQPALLVPVLVILAPLAALPLLITTLALVAVYAPDPDRRAAAEKILDRLLVTLRVDRRPGR